MKKVKKLTPGAIEAVHKALVEFGYPDLTEEYVKKQSERMLKGEKADNVIAMFIRDWLVEAKLLPSQ